MLATQETKEEGAEKSTDQKCEGSNKLPGCAKYALFFYFWSFFSQRCASAGLTTIDVYLIDNGFDEDQLALLKLVGQIPFVLKIVASWLNDSWSPPWKGSMFVLGGRRRPVIFYSSLLTTLGTVMFAIFVGSNPTFGSAVGCLFLATLGLTTVDQAVDGHSVELCAPIPPEYLSESLFRYTGRVTSMINAGFMLGFFFAIITVTQLGPAWSWTGAFLVIAAGGSLSGFLVVPLKDKTEVAQDKVGEVASCATICDMFKARGPNADSYRFFRKMVPCLILLGVYLGGLVFVVVPFCKREMDISVQQEGFIMVSANFGFGLGCVLGGLLVDLLGTFSTLMVALCLSSPVPIFILLAVSTGTVPLIMLSMFLAGLFAGPACMVYISVMYNNAPTDIPSFFIAVTYALVNFGLGFGGAILLGLAKRAGYAPVFFIMSGIKLFAIFYIFIRIRSSKNIIMRNQDQIGESQSVNNGAPEKEVVGSGQDASTAQVCILGNTAEGKEASV